MTSTFQSLNIRPELLKGLEHLGYETPSPVQIESIPILLSGHDLIAEAQTGTGKTAAFALPILQKLNTSDHRPQALILAPTRELAIQVAEAFRSYAHDLPGLRVLPIYGGQDFGAQLRALDRGVHVVVGTPGRVMDHLRRCSLNLDAVQWVVLDEADEMLKMGFLDDVEWILSHVTKAHQTALFSATMPSSIQKVAQKYLNKPEHVRIRMQTVTAEGIDQYVMQVAHNHKLEALTRYLEVEDFEAVLIFVRTKNITIELAEKMSARGYAATALNGDMSQSLRESVVERLKRGALDIVVATDVAARGLDVDRVHHVINYDAPYDSESYVHRIGRTGRAGRTGKSLLLVTPRERYLLRGIESITQYQMKWMEPPSVAQIEKRRVEKLITTIRSILAKEALDDEREWVSMLAHESESAQLDVAAALLFLMQEKKFRVKGLRFKSETDIHIPRDQNAHRPERAARPSFHNKRHGQNYGQKPNRSRKPY